MWRTMIYGVVMWTVTVYAFRRGGWTERLAAIGIITGSYLSALVASPFDRMFRKVEVEMAIVDFCLFIMLWCLALQTTKFWPLWLAAIQGVTVLAHTAPLLPHMSPYAVHRAVGLWSWPMWIILAFAVRRHQRSTSPI